MGMETASMVLEVNKGVGGLHHFPGLSRHSQRA